MKETGNVLVKRVLGRLTASALAILAVTGIAARAEAQSQRPPQYVLLAFDGSSSISMWKATREFAARSKLQNTPVNFTYFISGVYYVSPANKRKYIEPTRGAGASAIGWGDSDADLLLRYDQTNLAAEEKNEIASHANAHFGGDKWTLQNWKDEFRQFHTIIFDFFNFNNLKPTSLFPTGWVFGEKSMVGFRAPLLAVNSGLWQTLGEKGYRYDTSKTSAPNYWPERHPQYGFWNFPLAQLTIAGTGMRTLSMDYNFYYADSKALPNPANKERYKRQMLETYLQYFERNYNGNRAPVHIGHHFSQWNGGAYWEAMQEFAEKVCGRPETKCVTYSELADFMDSLSPQQLSDYRAGRFPKLTPVRIAAGVPTLDVDVRLAALPAQSLLNAGSEMMLQARVNGPDVEAIGGDRLEIAIAGEKLRTDSIGRTDPAQLQKLRLRLKGQTVETTTRILRKGIEISRATQSLSAFGNTDEKLSAASREDMKLMGDQPEAHMDETRL